MAPRGGEYEIMSPSSSTSSAPLSSLAAVEAAYGSVDGYQIARAEKRRQRDAGTFIEGIQYGEINSEAFAEALSWVSPRPGETFIDLGSGTGKAVLTAAAVYAFASVTGVEILRPLSDAAVAARERCDLSALPTRDVRFICADALSFPWTCIDVVFVSLTCFTDEQVAMVAHDVQQLGKGARILVTSRPLQSAALKLLKKGDLPYGKGRMRFLAYERV